MRCFCAPGVCRRITYLFHKFIGQTRRRHAISVSLQVQYYIWSLRCVVDARCTLLTIWAFAFVLGGLERKR